MYNNFDELIQGIHHGDKVVSDSEPAIIIDGYKRTLTPETGFNTQIGVTNDYNTNEITFKCDKIVDGHDLSACKNKAIKWHNPVSNMMGSDALEMTESDETTFTMTWHVPPEATTKAGTLRIAICFCDIDDNNKIIYKWNSLVYSGLQVAQGMDNIAIVGVPLSSIIDVNVYNRTITLPADFNTTIGMQYAYGTAKLTFRVNRFFNDWDFTEEDTEGQVLYIVGGDQKFTKLSDYRIIESLSGNIKDDWIEFDWKVPKEIFDYSGNFSMAIGFVSVERRKAWRSKELTTLNIEPSAFGIGNQIPESFEDGLAYELSEDKTYAICTGIGTCTDTDIIIASIYEDKPVTSISELAFDGCSSITSVEIPDSVTSIGHGAFYGCSNLKSISLGAGVEKIETNTFYACGKLTNINLGNSVTSIADHAFYKCGMKNIVIPDSVREIKEWVFSQCPNLKSITFAKGLQSIGHAAFYQNTSLEEVILPNSLISLAGYVFQGCTNLKSVVIPASVTTISDKALFQDCPNVTIYCESASKPAGWNEEWNKYNSPVVWDYVFDFPGVNKKISQINSQINTAIETLREELSDALGTIEIALDSILYTQKRLIGTSSSEGLSFTAIDGGYEVSGIGECTDTDIVIPKKYNGLPVISIDDRAFYNCDSLTSITIGDSVTSIGYYAFNGCTSLTSIVVDEENTVYHSAGNCLVKTKSKTLIAGCKNSVIPADGSVISIGRGAFQSCTSLTSITIPDSVTSIGEGAFQSCMSLTSVVIGDNVRGISNYAFRMCTSLTSIEIPDSVTSIVSGTFEGCTNLTDIYVPWSEGEVSGAPWGAEFATIHYNSEV